MHGLHLGAGTIVFAVAAVAMATLGAAALVLHGDRATRLGAGAIGMTVATWALCGTLAASTDDPAQALLFIRFGNAPLAWVGPALLLLLLSTSGRIDGNRAVLVVAAVIALASTLMALATPYNEAGVQATPLGFYGVAGPLHGVHVGQMGLWGGVGLVLARREQRRVRDPARALSMRLAPALLVLALVACTDILVEYQIGPGVPLAWLPVIVAGFGGAAALWRTNALRGESVDTPALVELVIAGVGGVITVAIVATARGTVADRPVTLAAVTAPLPVIAWLVASWLRQRAPSRAVDAEREHALVGFTEQVQAATDEAEIARGLAELVRADGGAVRVWRTAGDGFVDALGDGGPPPPLDARVRAWMIANRAPLFAGDVATLRLGGLRSLVEAYVAAHDVEAVVPLVDRDALVGLATVATADARAIPPGARALITEAAQIAAQAMTFAALRREAAARAETAREVEVAEAVQGARAAGAATADVGDWRVAMSYRPAAKVASDVWTWAALPAGAALLVVGDVVGRGVSAALVSAAVVGAVDATAAARGAALDPAELLALLDDVVVTVAGRGAVLGAFAVVLDATGARWAAAGHRGGYVVRRADGRGAVRALVARGNPLGDPARVIGRGAGPVADDEQVVLVSDGTIDVADGSGARWGERRLLRGLRTWLPADDRAADEVVAAALAHGGERPLPDDVLVLVARRRPAP